MLQGFVLIQRKAIEDDFVRLDHSHGQAWFQLKTCMRNMIIGPKDEMQSWQINESDEIIEGERSYQFLLEVICGLHSSLIGETEILGQFKNVALNFEFPNTHFGMELKKFIHAMLEDVKKVRSQHLSDLGSQSYGSLLRKEIKRLAETQVHILGAGHLCEEILPWIAKDGTDLHLHVRNVELAKKKFKNSNIHWHTIGESHSLIGILVIAAPIETKLLQGLISQSPKLKQVYDLRHNSESEPVTHLCDVKTLPQFMSVLNENVEFIQERKRLALQLIEQITKLRVQTVEHRPFGWEDMTAGSTHLSQLSMAPVTIPLRRREAKFAKQADLILVGEPRTKV